MSRRQFCYFLLPFVKEIYLFYIDLILNGHTLRLKFQGYILFELQRFFKQNNPITVKPNFILISEFVPKLIKIVEVFIFLNGSLELIEAFPDR